MGYAQPAEPKQGDSFSLKEHPEWANALVLIFPEKVNPAQKWNDAFDATETVSANIVILDRQGPDGQPIFLEDTMVFGKVMVAQLKENIHNGEKEVLGRIGQKQTNKGMAWTLTGFTAQDVDLADRWKATRPPTYAAAGGPPTPPPAQDPWAGMNATPAPPQAVLQQTYTAAAQQPMGVPADLAAFLSARGINVTGMTEAQARQIAATFQ